MSNCSIFPTYPGNKARMASSIEAFLDKTKTKYIETHVGAGGIFLNIDASKYKEILLVDKDKELMKIYKCLRDKKKMFMEILVNLNLPENIEEAKQDYKNSYFMKWLGDKAPGTDIDFLQAVNKYLKHAVSMNGAGKDFSEKYFCEFKNNLEYRLDYVMEMLDDRVKLNGLGYEKIIKKQCENENIQWVMDPPYVGIYRNNTDLYLNEMRGLDEHVMFIQQVNKCKGSVLICGYRSPDSEIPTIYDALLNKDFKCIKICDKINGAQIGVGKRKSCSEYVWTNYISNWADMYIDTTDYREYMTLEQYWDSIRNARKENRISKEQIMEYKKVFENV